MRADFYHLTAAPLDKVLPRICERLFADKERLLVVGEEPVLDALDAQLWAFSREGFLPHGRSGGANPERQPILLSTDVSNANGARNIAVADGQWREEALAFDRLFYFFGENRIEEARQSWIALKERQGVERRYWKQDARGKWQEGP